MKRGGPAGRYQGTGLERLWARVCAGILLLCVGSVTSAVDAPAAPEHIQPAAVALAETETSTTTTSEAAAAATSETTAAPRSQGVDAVLVIDSSGSMKQTDPRRLRVPAAKMFISLLTDKDRVGLVSFSDKGVPMLSLTAADKGNQTKLFAAVDKISSTGAYTNLHAALASGKEMLDREADGERRRMLVLMSDGKMDTGNFDQDTALLEKIRKDSIEALIKDGIEVYTIAFTEASDMPLLQEVAERTAALSRLASNDRELHEVFSQIFESAKQPDMLPLDDGAFMVDAAVEEVTVVASKATADVEVKLEMPDGRMIAAVNAGKAVRWFKSEQFDMITIDKPPAGQWHLRFSDNRGDKAYVVTKLGMDARIGEAPLYAGTEQTGEAWLHNDGEIVTKPEILGQTQFSVEITQPDGSKVEAPLADLGMAGDRAAGDGVFANLFSFEQPGQLKVRVIARNANFQREKALIVDVAAPTVDTTQPPVPAEPPVVEEPVTEAPVAEEAPAAEAPAEEPAAEDAPSEESLNLGLAISLFVLINLLIGGAVFGFLFWRKRKAAKAAAAAEPATEAEG